MSCFLFSLNHLDNVHWKSATLYRRTGFSTDWSAQPWQHVLHELHNPVPQQHHTAGDLLPQRQLPPGHQQVGAIFMPVLWQSPSSCCRSPRVTCGEQFLRRTQWPGPYSISSTSFGLDQIFSLNNPPKGGRGCLDISQLSSKEEYKPWK